MNVGLWYAVRRGATVYRSTGRTGQLVGAVRTARQSGATWAEIGRAAGYSSGYVRRFVG